jgi:hypothetical protein
MNIKELLIAQITIIVHAKKRNANLYKPTKELTLALFWGAENLKGDCWKCMEIDLVEEDLKLQLRLEKGIRLR